MSAVLTGLRNKMVTSIQTNPLLWLGIFLSFGCYMGIPQKMVWNWLRSWYDWFMGLTSEQTERVFEATKQLAKELGLDALIPHIQAGQDVLRKGLDIMSSSVVREACIAVFIVVLILSVFKR